ncbi:MAG TPA: right-handed parallel beta-helix repeat-containing protein [Planctomycetota bacterium]|nr:right-handed parallel beta-helix repeat-containing protein [Planctomycetota bacterium]
MNLSNLLSGTFRTLVSLVLCSAASADVIYVDASGNGQYSAIQPAITAAIDGDVLLVRTGNYAGFTLDNRRLSVIADVGALPKVGGKVTVRNLAANGTVLLAGLDIEPPLSPGQVKGLEVTNNIGHVRVQACTIHGCRGPDANGHAADGGPGVSVLNSSRAAFVASSLIGGNGGGIPLFIDYGGYGGHGVVTQGSSVAFYDCLLKGGVGGEADYVYGWEEGGDGGDGCHVMDFGILASGCQFQGGMGGSNASIGGEGGNGLVVDAGQAQLIGNTYAAGFGGWAYGGGSGPNGLPQTGAGVFHTFPGVARKIAGPSLAAESSTLQIEVSGDPGDRVWLLQTPQPEFVYFPSYAGIRLVALLSSFTVKPDVVLPPSGTASVLLRTRNVAGVASVSQYWQSLVENTAGQLRLGSPLHVAVLNCSDLLPDCDANGFCDSCDLLQPAVLDCDRNGVPDHCQPDCNANGIADTCDITNHNSADLNQNGIPDECENPTVWHIDANAAPGGNGSVGAPFQALGEAFAVSNSGDTLLVAPGTYQGSANRNLAFAGRELYIKGTGGAASCIVDCQLQGRAFTFDPGVPLGARIEGLTILQGGAGGNFWGGAMYIDGCRPTLRACRFVNCQAGIGGAVAFKSAGGSIEGCDFIGNSSPGIGGAIYVTFSPGSEVNLRDCTFENNHSGASGGALDAIGGVLRLERCRFENNQASSAGGALKIDLCQLYLDQCRIAGNSALVGGAVSAYNGDSQFTNCSIVDNSAVQRAGAVLFYQFYPTSRSWRNCVVWNNTAPGGTAIEVMEGPLDIAWCDVQGGQASVTLGSTATLIWGPGNLTGDPLFVDPDGADNNPLTVGDNDYRLSLTSPGLDAGDNASVAQDWFDLDGDSNASEPVPFDFDGNPRFVDVPSAPNTGNGASPLVDMGAWERP